MTSRRSRRQSFERFSLVLSIIGVGLLALIGIFISNKVQVKQIENVKSDVVLAKTLEESSVEKDVISSVERETDSKETEEVVQEENIQQAEEQEVEVSEQTDVVEYNQYAEVAIVDNTVNYTETANYTYDTTSYVASNATYSTTTLANGNTAGEIGSYAAAQMAAATGVAQETWEYIIARESNGDPNAGNVSGASGLFQTIPGWGSTATVEDQIQSALNAYNSQGLAAWGY